MMEKTAQVVSVDGERAVLSMQRQSACGACQARKGCGSAALGSVFDRQESLLALNRVGAVAGDYVRIGIDDSILVGSAVRMYLLPLVLMIVCAVITAGLFGGSDLAAAPGALAGLLAGFLLARHHSRKAPVGLLPEILGPAGDGERPVSFTPAKEDV
ncbi:SoxR reducing system RseC family protein [Granulosicoccaceae sp. 1_MG-2023]|nr:SoxR reducing system RseC family protein [Granulosicoccaceae sp. 1_MG-2023]